MSRFAGFLLISLLLAAPAWALKEVMDFQSPQEEELYHKLTEELRCLVCQNQNIADSNAELAQDLRKRTYKLIKQGQNEQQIVDFMIQRYGDFVLYRPELKSNTLLLWLGPFALLIFAVFFLLRLIRRRNSSHSETLTNEQRQHAEKLLSGDD